MNSLFTYLIELNISITLFFLIYLLIFRKDSNFNSRRAFLLFSMCASFIVPFINISISNPVNGLSTAIIQLEELIIVGGGSAATKSFSIISILPLIYLAVSLFFLGRLVLSIFKILKAAADSESISMDGKTVFLNKNLHASSFFQFIFIDPSFCKEKDMDLILKHESYHARLGHSFDRILSEILISLSWINPVLWVLRKSIVVNHEYQADNRVIELGTDYVTYQLSILNQYIGSASISNQFNSQIKNRIKMLNKNYKKGSYWKSLVLFPVSLALLVAISCSNEGPKDDIIDENLPAEEEIFYVVEEMPQWPDSEDMIMSVRKFIATNLTYPPEAIEKGAEGKVFVHFLVTKTGDVVIPDPSQLPPEQADDGSDKEVVVVAYRTLNSEQETPDDDVIQLFKDESVRVMELMPDLIPGKQRGEPVNVIFTMPITFKLQ